MTPAEVEGIQMQREERDDQNAIVVLRLRDRDREREDECDVAEHGRADEPFIRRRAAAREHRREYGEEDVGLCGEEDGGDRWNGLRERRRRVSSERQEYRNRRGGRDKDADPALPGEDLSVGAESCGSGC